jgi:tRNA A-37 threonylcarbamoyl transferase component Bud32
MTEESTTELLRDGRYAVARVLGEGSQGATLEAVDKQTGRAVAIKRFVVRGAKQWKDVELAEREARVLASLSHPSLPVYVDHFEENGCLYLVMEKIDGESLTALRKRGVSFSREDVVRFLREASGAIDYLHGRAPPIIHRDIKPSNVIRRPDGSYAFIDFGSVRDTLKPEGGSTVVGTFGYMAPEQFQGRALPGSDVFAVGATALALLTGVEPETLPHRGLALDVRAALGGHADPALARVLARMLEPDPDKRPASLAPLLGELDSRRSAPHGAPPWDAERWARDFGERYARDAKQWARDFSEQFARDAGQWEGYGNRVRHEVKRELRDARHQRRAERRRARRAYRRARRGRRGYGPLGSPVFVAFVLIALAVARLAVWWLFNFSLPLLLTLLSIVFGKNLKLAAERLRLVGDRGREGLRRTSLAVRDRADAGAARRFTDRTSAASEEPRARVADETRVRVREDEPSEEAEAEEPEPQRAARREER